MKTAMQELLDELKEYQLEFNIPIEVIDMCESQLNVEKEQIMNAYCDGAKGGANGTKGQHENGWVSIQMRNKYYNQKYNQKQHIIDIMKADEDDGLYKMFDTDSDKKH
jgi:hypothetical protein